MNLKSILAVFALALVAVKADERSDFKRTCNKRSGIFIEAAVDPSDTRYGCLCPKRNGDERTKFCLNINGQDMCYQPDIGNIAQCVTNSRTFNNRKCTNALTTLYNLTWDDIKKHDSSKPKCYERGGIFLEDFNSVVDTRFACLKKRSNCNGTSKYCVTYDDVTYTYEPSLSNIAYCDHNNKNYHGRGCALGLGYLYNLYRDDRKKHDDSKYACAMKKGEFLENLSEVYDLRFACLLKRQNGDEQNYYTCSYDGVDYTYNPKYGNIAYCDRNDVEYNSRGCHLGLTYLYGQRW